MNEINAEVLENHPNHFSENLGETHSYDADVYTTQQHNNMSTNNCDAYGYFDNNATVKPEEIIYENLSAQLTQLCFGSVVLYSIG